jgi:hypothetical protein
VVAREDNSQLDSLYVLEQGTQATEQILKAPRQYSNIFSRPEKQDREQDLKVPQNYTGVLKQDDPVCEGFNEKPNTIDFRKCYLNIRRGLVFLEQEKVPEIYKTFDANILNRNFTQPKRDTKMIKQDPQLLQSQDGRNLDFNIKVLHCKTVNVHEVQLANRNSVLLVRYHDNLFGILKQKWLGAVFEPKVRDLTYKVQRALLTKNEVKLQGVAFVHDQIFAAFFREKIGYSEQTPLLEYGLFDVVDSDYHLDCVGVGEITSAMFNRDSDYVRVFVEERKVLLGLFTKNELQLYKINLV